MIEGILIGLAVVALAAFWGWRARGPRRAMPPRPPEGSRPRLVEKDRHDE